MGEGACAEARLTRFPPVREVGLQKLLIRLLLESYWPEMDHWVIPGYERSQAWESDVFQPFQPVGRAFSSSPAMLPIH